MNTYWHIAPESNLSHNRQLALAIMEEVFEDKLNIALQDCKYYEIEDYLTERLNKISQPTECFNGVEHGSREIHSECWIVQFQGLKACEKCEFRNKKNCGGKEIRKSLRNAKGVKVPLGEAI